jgi:hypothetical protein
MLAEEEIAKMSVAERVETMERLWASFDSPEASNDCPTPAWHEDVLSERMVKMDSPDAVWLTLEELEARWADR